MKQIRNIGEYYSIVENYKQKGCLSNDYIQNEAADLIIHDKLFAECYEKNAFLFVMQNYGTRVFYYINDISEQADFSQYHNLDVEVLFRESIPQQEINFLIRLGFEVNIQRDLYCGIKKDLVLHQGFTDYEIKIADNIDDVNNSISLFNTTFDALSGDYLCPKESNELLSKKQILVAKSKDGKLLGAFHFSIKNNVVWGCHLAVFPEARGHSVGAQLLYSLIKETSIDDNTRYMWWVQHQNEAAIRLYQKTGLKYINKSTISLIKL